MSLWGHFLSNRRGQFAVLSAILIVPMIASAGLAIDYSRYVNARAHLQNLADAASLALASSKPMDRESSIAEAQRVVKGNNALDWIREIGVTDVFTNNDYVKVTLGAHINTTFTGVLGHDLLTLAVDSKAERAMMGSVEVSLILDNTWSMSETDDKGISKISALKSAASSLVNETMLDESGAIKIALVPYADYVNVGKQYRNKNWVLVPSDYVVPAVAATCVTKTTKNGSCLAKAPITTCTSTIDGITTTSTCGGNCTQYEQVTVAPYQSCSGGASQQNYTWYGCVGSRMVSDTRLNDGSPSVPYPGYLAKSQLCPNPIVPLSTSKATLLKAINDMAISIGSYKPNTYIPSGLVWGLNTLSPTEPFEQASAYDPKNKLPRKVAILMTDGENTLRFNSANGQHNTLSSNTTTAATQLKATNDDTIAICSAMKKKGIEIFTVAFMVDNETSKGIMQNCASGSDHYFDATDTSKLSESFQSIARSIRLVRLSS